MLIITLVLLSVFIFVATDLILYRQTLILKRTKRWYSVLPGGGIVVYISWKLEKAVLAKPTRSLKRALHFWYPKRLTFKDNPKIRGCGWLWWNL